MTFWDAFRSRQLHIVWLLQFLQQACVILFTTKFIHECATIIDKNDQFCLNHLIALLIAGLVSPLFGLLNDWLGIRVNNIISMILLSVIASGTIWIDKFDQKYSLLYLTVAFLTVSWSAITTSYSCVHLFGVRCGLYCLSYIRSSSILAASMLIPIMVIPDCSDASVCG